MAAAGVLGEIGTWVQVVVGVGLLIFIHELGHFLVARWAGVKVLAFSLGFGPVIAGFRRGDTHYRLSLVPLGGYVKMSGESELAGGGYAPDDYPAKPVGVRSLIIGAGVAMNAVLAYVLFAAALVVGLPLGPVRLGVVQPGEPAWNAGLRRGDLVLRAGGREVLDFEDIQEAVRAGGPVDLEIERDGAVRTVRVAPVLKPEAVAPAIGVSPDLGGRLAVAEGSPAHAAGFRSGDAIEAVEGVPVTLSCLLEEPVLALGLLPEAGPARLTLRRGTEFVEVPLEPRGSRPRIGIAPFREQIRAVRPGGPAAEAGFRPGDVPLSVGGVAVQGEHSFVRAVVRAAEGPIEVVVAGGPGQRTLALPGEGRLRVEALADLWFRSDASETRVEVAPSSPAAAAGIPSGARILRVDGAPVAAYGDLVARIRAAGDKPVTIAWAGTDGGGGEATVVPAAYADFFPAAPANLFPDGLSLEDDRPVRRITDVGTVASVAWRRTASTFRQLVAVLQGIFRGSVDRKNLGGPIFIGQIAREAAQAGPGRLLLLLAILSANLAVLNVIPIPPFDGGQLALLSVEAALRRPPSERVVIATQWTGLLFVLGLMVFFVFNDIERILGS